VCLEKWRSFHRSEEAHRQGLFPLLVSLLKEERHLSTIPFKGMSLEAVDRSLSLPLFSWKEKGRGKSAAQENIFLSGKRIGPLEGPLGFSSPPDHLTII